jgi:septal ring-binding cell division protein DamX
MPNARKNDLAKMLRLALDSLDARITELREMRAKLAAMTDRPSEAPAMEVAPPHKRRALSAAARAKISVATKARWDRERKARAKKQKSKETAKKAHVKAKPAKAKTTPVKAKKGKS